MHPDQRKALVFALVTKQGNARELSERFSRSVDWLRKFVEDNKQELEEARRAYELSQDTDDVTPQQLSELWITKKFERLQRYEEIANLLYEEAKKDPTDSTVLRELRSYLAAVANELGQLLHRGAGDAATGDTLSVDIQGVDLDSLR